MEWTDGMEYQLTKIAKTHIMAVAKLHISGLAIAHFNWTVMSSLCFLASYPVPRMEYSVRGRGYVLAVWMSGNVCVNWNEPKACHA